MGGARVGKGFEISDLRFDIFGVGARAGFPAAEPWAFG
jgi:hypothetical protein